MDENLRALRNTESVNQRLFNSLHEELRSYRDDFLRDSLQKPIIRDLIVLFDDLSAVAESVPTSSAEDGGNCRGRKIWHNTIHTLVEILHRLEVERNRGDGQGGSGHPSSGELRGRPRTQRKTV